MHLPEGLLLGLSTGTACLAFCGPIIIPYLMTESHSVQKNIMDVTWFLTGRFVAYIIAGILAGLFGVFFLQNRIFRNVVAGWLYIALSVFMVIYAFYRFRHICLGEVKPHLASKLGIEWPHALPAIGGFVSGINLCPPFILAITQASFEKSISGSLLFFVAFFLGTAVYFIPLPFIGIFRRRKALQWVGKFAAGIAGALYLYKGIILILK